MTGLRAMLVILSMMLMSFIRIGQLQMVHFMERRRTPTQSPRQRAREKAKRKNRKNIFAYFRELFTLKYDLWIKSDVIKFLMHKQLI